MEKMLLLIGALLSRAAVVAREVRLTSPSKLLIKVLFALALAGTVVDAERPENDLKNMTIPEKTQKIF